MTETLHYKAETTSLPLHADYGPTDNTVTILFI